MMNTLAATYQEAGYAIHRVHCLRDCVPQPLRDGVQAGDVLDVGSMGVQHHVEKGRATEDRVCVEAQGSNVHLKASGQAGRQAEQPGNSMVRQGLGTAPNMMHYDDDGDDDDDDDDARNVQHVGAL